MQWIGVMARDKKQVVQGGERSADVDAFLKKVAATPRVMPAGTRGRLLFAMDATASREAS